MKDQFIADVKRETMYIKDDNQWQKDVRDKINSAIQGVSQKSIITLMDWKKQTQIIKI